MQNKTIATYIIILLFSSLAKGDEKKLMSKEEALQLLLPHSIEGNSPGEFERFLTLRDAGESAYPALVEVYFQTKDIMITGAIAAIFIQSKGDKTIPVQALRNYVTIHGKEIPLGVGIPDAVMVLGRLGGEKEALVLRELLPMDDVLMRHSVENGIKQIETRQRTAERQAATRVRPNNKELYMSSKEEGRISKILTKNEFISVFYLYWKWLCGGLLIVAVFFFFRRSANPTE